MSNHEGKDFEGKVAIVTGGGTGLGKAMAHCLARQGAKVVVASRNPEHLDSAVKEISEAGGSVIAVPTDVRNPDAVQSMVNKTMSEHGKIDILINNAAGNFVIPSEKLTVNGWNAVVGIVLNGTWYCTSAVGKEMIRQQSGCILNIIATFAWTGCPGVVHSASAKAGVLAMTRTIAAEWGHYGIRCNALAPGIMVTEGASKNLKFDTAEAQESLRTKIPLGRLGAVEEVAELAVFLCSPKAAYINGDVMTADGGGWLTGKNYLDV